MTGPLAPAPARPALAETLGMYRSMVGIALVCGLAIVLAFRWTKPVIERNRAEALRAAIFQVLPAAESAVTFRLDEASGGFRPLEGKAQGAPVVHAGFDGGGRLVGLAIEAQGMGYQDVIKVLYGYDPQAQAIVGFKVLETRETPGLGDKIDFDPGFLANFERLDVALTADGSALAHPIESVKQGQKTAAWQVDAITGATVSSKAVANLLRASAGFWAPRIRPRIDDFRPAS